MANVLLVFMLVALLGVLVAGIFVMAKGGKTGQGDGSLSNKLMVARVAIQGSIVMLIGLGYFLTR